MLNPTSGSTALPTGTGPKSGGLPTTKPGPFSWLPNILQQSFTFGQGILEQYLIHELNEEIDGNMDPAAGMRQGPPPIDYRPYLIAAGGLVAGAIVIRQVLK